MFNAFLRIARHRQTSSETGIGLGEPVEKQAERQAYTDRGKISDRRTVRLTRTDRQTTYTDRRTERQTKRQTDRKTDRKTDRQTQTDRQIDRQT